MKTKAGSVGILFLLAIVVAFSLSLGASARTGQIALARIAPEGSSAARDGVASELLVGRVSCFFSPPDPGFPNVSVSLDARGTIPIDKRQEMNGPELVSSGWSAETDPCPEFFQAARANFKGLGCTTGPDSGFGYIHSFGFVCHDQREAIVNVLAVVSEQILSAGP